MNRLRSSIIAFMLALSALVSLYAALPAYGSHGETALYSVGALYSNTGGAITRQGIPMPVSASRLIDGDFIAANALNTAVQSGSNDIPAMPGSDRIEMLGAAYDTEAQMGPPNIYTTTTQTTEANNEIPNDMVLVNTTSTIGDSYYYGADTPFRVLTINVGTAGEGNYEIQWQYYSGTNGWSPLDGVVDNTNGYKVAGTSTISWLMPNDMTTSTIGAITAYWVRSTLIGPEPSPTTTVAARGTRAYWETGQWWVYAETIPASGSANFDLYLGGPDLQDSHPIFVGVNGVTTTDAADLELGANSWEILLSALFKTNTTSTDGALKRLAYKPGVLDMYLSDNNEVTADITGTTTTASVVLFTVPEGEHVISLQYIAANGEIRFFLDGDQSTSTAPGLTIVNNDSPWYWGINGSVAYFDYIKVRIAFESQLSLRPDQTIAKDAYVINSLPTTNFGDSDSLAITNSTGFSPSIEWRTFIQFDASLIPSAAVIASATLQLTAASDMPNSSTGTLHVVADTWSESTVTWDNQPSVYAGELDSISFGTTNVGQQYEWDVTNAVIDWHDGSIDNNGIRLVSSALNLPNGRLFDSGESTTAIARPLMVIEFSNSVPFDGSFTDANNVLWYQLMQPPTVLIQDESGNGNNGRLYWPEQPAGLGNPNDTATLTVTLGPITPLTTPESLAVGLPAAAIAGEAETPPNLFNTSTGAAFPVIGPLIAPFFENAGVPVLLFWVAVCMGTSLLLIIAAYLAMKIVFMAAIAGALPFVVLAMVSDGILPLLLVFVYAAIAALVVFMGRDVGGE